MERASRGHFGCRDCYGLPVAFAKYGICNRMRAYNYMRAHVFY